jgi:hypothetical protein
LYDDRVAPDHADLEVADGIALSDQHAPLPSGYAVEQRLPRRPAHDAR